VCRLDLDTPGTSRTSHVTGSSSFCFPSTPQTSLGSERPLLRPKNALAHSAGSSPAIDGLGTASSSLFRENLTPPKSNSSQRVSQTSIGSSGSSKSDLRDSNALSESSLTVRMNSVNK
jgi:hypothetical protein